MKSKFVSLVLSLVSALLLSNCKVDPKIKPVIETDNVAEIIPEGWPQPYYTFSTNPVSEAGFILGRALFYETLLSKDNTISCGTCHQLNSAFANTDHKLSHGINDLLGTRNTPGLFNLTWHTSFMHDGGINHIENQPPAPITNTVEMGEDLNTVVKKLQESEKYRNLFKNAFGDELINTQRIFKAITQFQGLIYSYNSKYDNYKAGKAQFSEAESRGYALFLAKCNACHKEPLFSDFQFRSNGLPVDPSLNDIGRAMIENQPENYYKFKTPSLRNIAKTGPYMHDGRYSTLQQCLNHYTNGITNLTNLDPLLINGIQMTDSEKADIIEFLFTLTDYKLLSDQRFADPNFQ
ncbi:MAG: cytochrome-c peroxidase [Bacteroidia bacterium]|jgi:cytochrome c peroxidase|nr:cytochrome-c peroxidase [Bacteroidia bacterium]